MPANTTDPQSRSMPTRKGFLQGCNAQVAVSGDPVILAVAVTRSPNDQSCFVPMMRAAERIAENLHALTAHRDHRSGRLLADAGYDRDANLAAIGPPSDCDGLRRAPRRSKAVSTSHGNTTHGEGPRGWQPYLPNTCH